MLWMISPGLVAQPWGCATGEACTRLLLPLNVIMAYSSRVAGRDSMGGKTSPIMLRLELPVGWDELTSTGSGSLRSRITHHVRLKVRVPTGGDILIKPWNGRQTDKFGRRRPDKSGEVLYIIPII